jgi:hypothetical protein
MDQGHDVCVESATANVMAAGPTRRKFIGRPLLGAVSTLAQSIATPNTELLPSLLTGARGLEPGADLVDELIGGLILRERAAIEDS